MDRLAQFGRNHWFYLLLPIWLAAALAFRTTHDWAEQPAFGEATTLIDWCLFVPALYALCNRHMPRRALLLRTLAIACGGIWIAGKIVPDAAQFILQDLGWFRVIGMAVLVLFEAFAVVAILRVLFGATPDPRALERHGIPPLLVKLMLAEARFWRWVWTRLQGK